MRFTQARLKLNQPTLKMNIFDDGDKNLVFLSSALFYFLKYKSRSLLFYTSLCNQCALIAFLNIKYCHLCGIKYYFFKCLRKLTDENKEGML